MKHVKTLLIAGLTVLALSACSSGNDAVEETTGAAGGDAGAGAATVSIVDNAFEPAEVEIASGETVSWTHEGEVTHTVTFEDEDSGDLEPGETFERTFDESGEHGYVCTIHPSMEGTVTVTG